MMRDDITTIGKRNIKMVQKQAHQQNSPLQEEIKKQNRTIVRDGGRYRVFHFSDYVNVNKDKLSITILLVLRSLVSSCKNDAEII